MDEMMNTTPETGDVTPPEDMRVGICPYYDRDRGKGRVYCECARFRFPDAGSRREIVYRFCAHPTGYKDCALKICMDHYYERKYAYHEEDESGNA